MQYEDKTLICMQCGKNFVWTKGEQKFMDELLANGKIKEVKTPRNCAKCRALRKKQSNNKHDFVSGRREIY